MGHIVNNIVITMHGITWVLDWLRWSLHRVYKCLITMLTPETNIILFAYCNWKIFLKKNFYFPDIYGLFNFPSAIDYVSFLIIRKDTLQFQSNWFEAEHLCGLSWSIFHVCLGKICILLLLDAVFSLYLLFTGYIVLFKFSAFYTPPG